MNLKSIKADSIALLVAGLLIAVVGLYTQNGGFQLAGALVFLGGLALAFKQARTSPDQS